MYYELYLVSPRYLLERIADIKDIQELLGHNAIKITLRYTHVSKKELGKIESHLTKYCEKVRNPKTVLAHVFAVVHFVLSLIINKKIAYFVL